MRLQASTPKHSIRKSTSSSLAAILCSEARKQNCALTSEVASDLHTIPTVAGIRTAPRSHIVSEAARNTTRRNILDSASTQDICPPMEAAALDSYAIRLASAIPGEFTII